VGGVKLRFWRHQAIEYLVALIVLATAFQGGGGSIAVYVTAAVFALLAATSDGPVSAFRVVPRPMHRVVDLVAAAGLVALGLIAGDGTGDLVATLGGAALLVFLSWRTDWTVTPKRRTVVIDEPGPSRSEDIGRAAGKLVGGAAAKGVSSAKAWRSKRSNGSSSS
jgi:hypothetical protein